MFSFHKPKIYRSNLGCCICKAKSSSSRFTDSKKYENEFEQCFRIEEKRSGEICNACVLLVKRWKKLSPENRLTKHWHHVVDARAGPGTKLTSGRRFAGPSSSGGDASGSGNYQSTKKQPSASNRSDRGEVLPLSSSQSNNQSGAASSTSTSSSGQVSRRATGLSNKARAIDTNVSTFTFGEPIRRSYMATEPISSSTSFNKPQSALNSSAFESVIKRFRQRKQQEQLEAERRLLNRQQRQQQQQQQQQPPVERPLGPTAAMRKQLPTQITEASKVAPAVELVSKCEMVSGAFMQPTKRVKRSSESIGSLCVDGLRVSTLLDTTIWRKEKICCGTIFCGKFNEVAIFPRLLKPCSHRIKRAELERKRHLQQEQMPVTEDEEQPVAASIVSPTSPPPRAQKSGSISSYDSSTSGTGSMEIPSADRLQVGATSSRQKPSRPTLSKATAAAQAERVTGSTRSTRRHQKAAATSGEKMAAIDTDSTTSSSTASSSSSSAFSSSSNAAANQEAHSPGASSEASSSRMLIMAGEAYGFEVDEEQDVMDEMEDEDEEEEMALGEDDEDVEDEDEDGQSNEDASSSVKSLAGGQEKSGVVGAMG